MVKAKRGEDDMRAGIARMRKVGSDYDYGTRCGVAGGLIHFEGGSSPLLPLL